MKRQIILILAVAFFIISCAVVYVNRNNIPAFQAEAPEEKILAASQSALAPEKETEPPPPVEAPEPIETPTVLEELVSVKEDAVTETELTKLLRDGTVPRYDMTLKQLIDTAEARIKKIDKVLKAREDEKLTGTLIEEGDALLVEGKFADAKGKYLEARKLAVGHSARREVNDRIRKADREKCQRKPCTNNFTPKS